MKFLAAALALTLLVIAGCNPPAEQAQEPGSGTTPESVGKSDVATGNEAQSGATPVTYAAVQEIFDQKCVACHGENGKEDIDLRSYESLMRGGEHGPIVVAGKPEDSDLVKSLRGGHGVTQMPFNQDPLPEEQIVVIENWVREGAKT